MVRITGNSFVTHSEQGEAVGRDTPRFTAAMPAWPRREGAWSSLPIVAEFADDESDPTIQHTHHAAGLGGRGGSLPMDNAICSDIDKNGGFGSPDGTLKTREYYCHNYRGDVCARITDDGQMLEWVQYSPYGVPFAQPAGDTDGDGDADQADLGNILSWISSGYDVTGDLDLDGDVDAADSSLFSTATLGRGVLSGDDEYQHFGYTGHRHDEATPILVHARNRMLHTQLGRWLRRDPLGYVDGMNLYEYVAGRPVASVDPNGLNLFADEPEQPDIIAPRFPVFDPDFIPDMIDDIDEWLKNRGQPPSPPDGPQLPSCCSYRCFKFIDRDNWVCDIDVDSIHVECWGSACVHQAYWDAIGSAMTHCLNNNEMCRSAAFGTRPEMKCHVTQSCCCPWDPDEVDRCPLDGDDTNVKVKQLTGGQVCTYSNDTCHCTVTANVLPSSFVRYVDAQCQDDWYIVHD